MCRESQQTSFPHEIVISSEDGVVMYTQLPGHFAIHGSLPDALGPSQITELDQEAISICRGNWPCLDQLDPGTTVTPVYAPGGTSAPFVPTGLVFIRFNNAIMANHRREAIERAGYTISRLLPYAPHTAWLEARSGKINDALAQLDSLTFLDGVEAVAPQLLSPVRRR